MNSRFRSLSIERLNCRRMLSANAELFLDINEGEGSSLLTSNFWTELDGLLFFAADDGIHGTELWTTDGTPEGTKLVADLNDLDPEDPESDADTASALPTDLTVFNGEVYFAATTADGDELWKSDGTAAGTVMVADIREGDGNSFPQHLTVFKDELYFAASTEDEGGELWKSDGTDAGTELVADIVPGGFGSSPSELYVFNDQLFFSASPDEQTGPELFRSDGTEEGTVLVKDINEDLNQGSFPEGFFEFNDELYFIAADRSLAPGQLSTHLFKSDGSEAGTVKVTPERMTLNLLFEPNVVEFNDHLYYGGIANETWEVFRTDGNAESSELVADLQGAFPSSPTEFTAYNGELYFAANDPTGRQVWKTNGEVGDDNVSEQITFVERGVSGMFPSEFIVFNGSLFFNGHDGERTFQVWELNGDTVEPLTQLERGPNTEFFMLFHEFDNKLFFRGGGDEGLEFWTVEKEQMALLDGDVDGNGMVEFADFLILSANFGKEVGSREQGDLDGNGLVEFADFLVLSRDFGKSVDAAFSSS